MDRWVWVDVLPTTHVWKASGVTIYDGDCKTTFRDGELFVCDEHIFWNGNKNIIALDISLIVLAEEHVEGTLLSKKYFTKLHLQTSPPDKKPGPVSYSQFHQIQLRVTSSNTCTSLFTVISQRIESKAESSTKAQNHKHHLNLRGGLYHIEKDLQQRDAAVSRDVAEAFQDFQNLMTKAGEMVNLAKTIAEKEKKHGKSDSLSVDMSEADLVEFRSDLLALGVSSPSGVDEKYAQFGFNVRLASEICNLLVPIIKKDGGGLMSLTEAYCRLNRARGLALVSPDDVSLIFPPSLIFMILL